MIDLSKKKYILFDLDGTMVDLESLNYKCFREAANKISGKDLSFDEYMNFIAGVGSRRGLTSYFRSINLEVADETLEVVIKGYKQQKKLYLRNNFNEVVTLKEGIGEFLINSLKFEKKLAVATSTRREFALLILEQANLKKYFDVIVTVDDVVSTKPDPETFLSALEKLGGTTSEAVIFEDSKNGVLAANNAKIDYFVIWNKGKNDEVANACDNAFGSYTELLPLLG